MVRRHVHVPASEAAAVGICSSEPWFCSRCRDAQSWSSRRMLREEGCCGMDRDYHVQLTPSPYTTAASHYALTCHPTPHVRRTVAAH